MCAIQPPVFCSFLKFVNNFAKSPSYFCLHSTVSTQGRRNVWGHKDWSSPCFQDSVNPISTRGADYAHHSTTVLTMLKYVPAALLSIWRGASHMWYMSKDFLGFIHSVPNGNIVGNLWFGYNCQLNIQKTQNWENLVISGLFKWHKFTSYPSHSAIYCVYLSKITNLSWNIIT